MIVYLLVGLGLLSHATMAVALLGLVQWPILLVLGVAGVALAIRYIHWLWGEWKTARPLPWWIPLGFIPLLSVFYRALAPDREVDALTYHLGIPDQILRVGKYVFDGGQCAQAIPVGAEMIYLYAVALGWDALPHLIQWLPFSAALLYICSWVGRGQEKNTAPWVACIAILCTGVVMRSLPVAKNDLFAASYIVVGTILATKGRFLLSGLIFGLAASIKPNEQVYCATGALWIGLCWGGRVIPWLTAASVPAGLWMLKAWFWTGNPIWPANGNHTQLGLWDRFDQMSGIHFHEHPGPWIPDIINTLRIDAPLLIFGAVFLLWIPKSKMIWYSLGAAVVMSLTFPAAWVRMNLPAVVLLTAGVVRGAAIAQGNREWPLIGLAGLSIIPMWGEPCGGGSVKDATVYYKTLSQTKWAHGALSTMADARDALEGRPGRLAICGDLRGYRMPMKIWSCRNYPRSIGWEAAREYRTVSGVRKYFRQRNIATILYNPVTAGFPHQGDESYTWTIEQAKLWRSFVDQWLDLDWMGETLDTRNGAFVIYAVRNTPKKPVGWLPYLPGMENLWYVMLATETLEQYMATAQYMDSVLPNVDWLRNRLGHGYLLRGEYKRAADYLWPGLVHGTLDDGACEQGMFAFEKLGNKAIARELAAALIRIKPERAEIGRAALERMGR